MLTNDWKNWVEKLMFWTIPVSLVSFGLANILNISVFSILSIMISVVISYIGYQIYYPKKIENPLISESEILSMRESLDIYERELEEQVIVIKEYDEIFDSLLVDVPCTCGGNIFKGLLSPYQENLVTCDKCKCNYRVEVHYDAVLISEPLDQKEL